MKKIFGFLMAVAVLFTTSCAKEDISSSIANGEQVEVTFTANLPELGTRAYGEGKSATTLRYYVYEQTANGLALLPALSKGVNDTDELVAINADGKATVRLALVKGMTYTIVFWADHNKMYTINTGNQTVTINYGAANDDTRDAFFACEKDFKPADSTGSQIVELRRPFAQLNAATDDLAAVANSGIDLSTLTSSVVVEGVYSTLNLVTGDLGGETTATFTASATPDLNGQVLPGKSDYNYLSMNYVLVGVKKLVKATFTISGERINSDDTFALTVNEYTNVPLQRNYRTNILGSLITNTTVFDVEILPDFDDSEYEVEGDVVTANVDTVEEFAAAFADNSGIDVVVLDGDINLNDLLTRAEAADPSYTVKAGKTLTIDLNGKKLSATSTQTGKNYNMFNVRGTLTVKNGTIEYKHEGDNMGWGASTNIFDVTAGGILNLKGVTAKNLGGSDMGFVAHLNNWGEVTLNVENCTLESNYVPVRVFNSGPDMNNVTIKNSTLNGVSAAFWVHNYTAVDFGGKLYSGSSEAYDKERVAARLKLNIYNQGNTFSPDLNGIRYGFTNSIRTDAYGITKTVSEDGTEVTLGSIIENGLIRRGVAGTEENTTIKKAIVGEGVTTLYDRTFRRFYALETVELPSTLTTIGAAGSGVFQSCTALKNIVLPESVTVLGKGSFQECSSLESINIPAGVTRIEADCLRATGLKEVEFHAGVTYFGAQAFRDCKQLTKVVINAPEFTMENNTFGIMAAPFTPMTIEVANAEMKAYVESKLTDNAKTYITVVAPTAVTNKESLQAALDNAIKAGETNIKIDATNFTGDLNYGFTNSNVPTGVTVTIRNAKVTGISHNNSANGTLVFDNCSFSNNSAYSINFIGGNGHVVFNKCELVGWCSFGGVTVEMNNCSVAGNGMYALVRSYNTFTMNNCTIDCTNTNTSDGYHDGVSIGGGAVMTMTGCTMINAGYEYGEAADRNTMDYSSYILVNGKRLACNPDSLVAAMKNGDAILMENDINVNGSLKVAEAKNKVVDIDGNNHTLTTGLVNGSGVNGITMSNMTLVGSDTNYTIFANSGKVVMTNVTVSSNYNQAVCLSGGGDVVLTDCNISGDVTGDYAASNIWCGDGRNVTVNGGTYGSIFMNAQYHSGWPAASAHAASKITLNYGTISKLTLETELGAEGYYVSATLTQNGGTITNLVENPQNLDLTGRSQYNK